MSSKTLYTRKSESISGRLDDELVMMDIEKGQYFSLNPVATRVWELLEQPSDLISICSKLIEEYDVDPELCKKEVNELLQKMEKLGLVFQS